VPFGLGRAWFVLVPAELAQATADARDDFPMPHVTCLDAELSERTRPKVIVRRHPVDWDDPAEGTEERAAALLSEQPNQCVYLNPAFTVTCPEPTPEFFQEVRKRQAEWCRRASRTIPGWIRRRVSRWVGAGHQFRSKSERYFHRAFCYSGVLFINGQLTHPSQWRRLEDACGSTCIPKRPKP